MATWPGYGVHRYLPDGTLDAVIPLPVSNVSSCEFGGAGPARPLHHDAPGSCSRKRSTPPSHWLAASSARGWRCPADRGSPSPADPAATCGAAGRPDHPQPGSLTRISKSAGQSLPVTRNVPAGSVPGDAVEDIGRRGGRATALAGALGGRRLLEEPGEVQRARDGAHGRGRCARWCRSATRWPTPSLHALQLVEPDACRPGALDTDAADHLERDRVAEGESIAAVTHDEPLPVVAETPALALVVEGTERLKVATSQVLATPSCQVSWMSRSSTSASPSPNCRPAGGAERSTAPVRGSTSRIVERPRSPVDSKSRPSRPAAGPASRRAHRAGDARRPPRRAAAGRWRPRRRASGSRERTLSRERSPSRERTHGEPSSRDSADGQRDKGRHHRSVPHHGLGGGSAGKDGAPAARLPERYRRYPEARPVGPSWAASGQRRPVAQSYGVQPTAAQQSPRDRTGPPPTPRSPLRTPRDLSAASGWAILGRSRERWEVDGPAVRQTETAIAAASQPGRVDTCLS